MEQLMKILKDIRPDVDFENATDLIDSEILDSFDIISIVSEVNDAFGVEINVDDLLPENFNSAEALYELIKKMQAG
ncbi:MAG: acyl carrier protein [Lachnospiraceae bacterium]|nr:acyl carrier protein [Lachnospiraceae bacterium]